MTNLEATFYMQIKAVGLPEPIKEFRFHPIRKWRFDFAWLQEKVAVECDGGTYTDGRHTRGKGFNGDCHKQNEAILLGWKVLRGDPEMVKSGELLGYLEKALGK